MNQNLRKITRLLLYMIQVWCSQKYGRMFFKNLISYLASSQNWLNLHCQFGYITKFPKEKEKVCLRERERERERRRKEKREKRREEGVDCL